MTAERTLCETEDAFFRLMIVDLTVGKKVEAGFHQDDVHLCKHCCVKNWQTLFGEGGKIAPRDHYEQFISIFSPKRQANPKLRGLFLLFASTDLAFSPKQIATATDIPKKTLEEWLPAIAKEEHGWLIKETLDTRETYYALPIDRRKALIQAGLICPGGFRAVTDQLRDLGFQEITEHLCKSQESPEAVRGLLNRFTRPEFWRAYAIEQEKVTEGLTNLEDHGKLFISGSSGSGKSAFVSVVAGFWLERNNVGQVWMADPALNETFPSDWHQLWNLIDFLQKQNGRHSPQLLIIDNAYLLDSAKLYETWQRCTKASEKDIQIIAVMAPDLWEARSSPPEEMFKPKDNSTIGLEWSPEYQLAMTKQVKNWLSKEYLADILKQESGSDLETLKKSLKVASKDAKKAWHFVHCLLGGAAWWRAQIEKWDVASQRLFFLTAVGHLGTNERGFYERDLLIQMKVLDPNWQCQELSSFRQKLGRKLVWISIEPKIGMDRDYRWRISHQDSAKALLLCHKGDEIIGIYNRVINAPTVSIDCVNVFLEVKKEFYFHDMTFKTPCLINLKTQRSAWEMRIQKEKSFQALKFFFSKIRGTLPLHWPISSGIRFRTSHLYRVEGGLECALECLSKRFLNLSVEEFKDAAYFLDTFSREERAKIISNDVLEALHRSFSHISSKNIDSAISLMLPLSKAQQARLLTKDVLAALRSKSNDCSKEQWMWLLAFFEGLNQEQQRIFLNDDVVQQQLRLYQETPIGELNLKIQVVLIGGMNSGKFALIRRLKKDLPHNRPIMKLEGDYVPDYLDVASLHTKPIMKLEGEYVIDYVIEYRWKDNRKTVYLVDVAFSRERWHDLGWKKLNRATLGYIYIIDGTNYESHAEALEWFTNISDRANPGAPILILLNKADLAEFIPFRELSHDLLSLFNTFQRDDSIRIFETSLLTGQNVDRAIEWFFSKVLSRKCGDLNISRLLGFYKR